MKYNVDNRHKKKTPWTNSWPVLILLTLIFILSARAAWNSYSRKITSRQAAEAKNEQLQKLEDRQAFLQEELRKIDTAEGKEAVLREDFGLGRPDEQLAIIVEAKPAEKTAAASNKFWSAAKSFISELFKK